MGLKFDNNAFFKLAYAYGTKAGYEGLLTVRKAQQYFAMQEIMKFVEDKYGLVKHAWITLSLPGSEGILAHGHNRDTVVYFPRDHECSLWVQEAEGPIAYPTKEGGFVFIPAGMLHWVGENDTNEARVTVVFTLEKT